MTENVGKCTICRKRRQLLGEVGSGLNQYCKQCLSKAERSANKHYPNVGGNND